MFVWRPYSRIFPSKILPHYGGTAAMLGQVHWPSSAKETFTINKTGQIAAAAVG